MQTIAPAIENFAKRDVVIKVSRERYGRDRALVEEKIARWSDVALQGKAEDRPPSNNQPSRREERAPAKAPSPQKFIEKELEDVVVKAVQNEITDLAQTLRTAEAKPSRASHQPNRSARQLYPVTCDRCGKKTEVPFEPAPDKKVYCRECFALIKEERKKTTFEQGEAPKSKSVEATVPRSKIQPPIKANSLPQKSPKPSFNGPKPPPLPA